GTSSPPHFPQRFPVEVLDLSGTSLWSVRMPVCVYSGPELVSRRRRSAMWSRRRFLENVAAVPLVGSLTTAGAAPADAAQTPSRKGRDYFRELGVRPFINAGDVHRHDGVAHAPGGD